MLEAKRDLMREELEALGYLQFAFSLSSWGKQSERAGDEPRADFSFFSPAIAAWRDLFLFLLSAPSTTSLISSV